MMRTSVGDHTIVVSRGVLPAIYGEYQRHAVLAEAFDLSEPEGDVWFVGVGAAGDDWPALVVAQRFSPASGGFEPGVLVVPETRVVFIGAGKRLLAYSLYGPRRLWEDTADVGFWGWTRHGNHVLMSAELELAAWEISGRKLWSTFVEPPWSYRVEGRRVVLDVMGRKSTFPLQTGPFPEAAQHRPLDRERDWPFFHPQAVIPEHALALIRPLMHEYCNALWRTYVSTSHAPYIGTMPPGEWPRELIVNGRSLQWADDWSDSRPDRVSALLREHLPWPDDTTVYFFWTNRRGVATRWSVFRDHWITFLFDDEFPILISPEHRAALIFTPGHRMHIGVRPASADL